MSIDTTAVIDTTPAVTSTVYSTASPNRAPQGYIGRHRREEPARRPARRGRRWLAAALSVVGISLTIACGAGAIPDAKPLNDAPKATSAPAAKKGLPAGIGDGQHKVGTDIAAGTYTTTVPVDSLNCYWARLKAFDGELSSVIANGNLDPRAKGRIVVKKTDAGVEFTGGCLWVKAAK